MADEHRQQAAVLLGEARVTVRKAFETSRPREVPVAERELLVLEALVHAVLHLAEVVEIREAITTE